MKLARTALIAITTLNVYAAHANGLVLHFDVETGELSPITKPDKPAKAHPNASSLKRRSFQGIGPVQPSKEVLDAIEATALQYVGSKALASAHLSPIEWIALFRANIEVESAYNPTIVSKAGAVGLGQLMPETASLLDVEIDDPADNLRGSAEYLLWLLDSFGSPDLAIAAYNAGPEAVAKHRGVPPFSETREHVRKVLGVFFRLRKVYTQQEGAIQVVSE